MAENLNLSDKVLKMEQEIAQLKIELQTGFINEPITPMKAEDEQEFEPIDFNPSPGLIELKTPVQNQDEFSDFDFGQEQNADLKGDGNFIGGDYNTEVQKPRLMQHISERVDGLPTILE